jgi:hypothetical protein
MSTKKMILWILIMIRGSVPDKYKNNKGKFIDIYV